MGLQSDNLQGATSPLPSTKQSSAAPEQEEDGLMGQDDADGGSARELPGLAMDSGSLSWVVDLYCRLSLTFLQQYDHQQLQQVANEVADPANRPLAVGGDDGASALVEQFELVRDRFGLEHHSTQAACQRLVFLYNRRALLCLGEEQYDEAYRVLQAALLLLRGYSRYLEFSLPLLVFTLQNVAVFQFRLQQFDSAEKYLRLALSKSEAHQYSGTGMVHALLSVVILIQTSTLQRAANDAEIAADSGGERSDTGSDGGVGGIGSNLLRGTSSTSDLAGRSGVAMEHAQTAVRLAQDHYAQLATAAEHGGEMQLEAIQPTAPLVAAATSAAAETRAASGAPQSLSMMAPPAHAARAAGEHLSTYDGRYDAPQTGWGNSSSPATGAQQLKRTLRPQQSLTWIVAMQPIAVINLCVTYFNLAAHVKEVGLAQKAVVWFGKALHVAERNPYVFDDDTARLLRTVWRLSKERATETVSLERSAQHNRAIESTRNRMHPPKLEQQQQQRQPRQRMHETPPIAPVTRKPGADHSTADLPQMDFAGRRMRSRNSSDPAAFSENTGPTVHHGAHAWATEGGLSPTSDGQVGEDTTVEATLTPHEGQYHPARRVHRPAEASKASGARLAVEAPHHSGTTDAYRAHELVNMSERERMLAIASEQRKTVASPVLPPSHNPAQNPNIGHEQHGRYSSGNGTGSHLGQSPNGVQSAAPTYLNSQGEQSIDQRQYQRPQHRQGLIHLGPSSTTATHGGTLPHVDRHTDEDSQFRADPSNASGGTAVIQTNQLPIPEPRRKRPASSYARSSNDPYNEVGAEEMYAQQRQRETQQNQYDTTFQVPPAAGLEAGGRASGPVGKKRPLSASAAMPLSGQYESASPVSKAAQDGSFLLEQQHEHRHHADDTDFMSEADAAATIARGAAAHHRLPEELENDYELPLYRSSVPGTGARNRAQQHPHRTLVPVDRAMPGRAVDQRLDDMPEYSRYRTGASVSGAFRNDVVQQQHPFSSHRDYNDHQVDAVLNSPVEIGPETMNGSLDGGGGGSAGAGGVSDYDFVDIVGSVSRHTGSGRHFSTTADKVELTGGAHQRFAHESRALYMTPQGTGYAVLALPEPYATLAAVAERDRRDAVASAVDHGRKAPMKSGRVRKDHSSQIRGGAAAPLAAGAAEAAATATKSGVSRHRTSQSAPSSGKAPGTAGEHNAQTGGDHGLNAHSKRKNGKKSTDSPESSTTPGASMATGPRPHRSRRRGSQDGGSRRDRSHRGAGSKSSISGTQRSSGTAGGSSKSRTRRKAGDARRKRRTRAVSSAPVVESNNPAKPGHAEDSFGGEESERVPLSEESDNYSVTGHSGNEGGDDTQAQSSDMANTSEADEVVAESAGKNRTSANSQPQTASAEPLPQQDSSDYSPRDLSSPTAAPHGLDNDDSGPSHSRKKERATSAPLHSSHHQHVQRNQELHSSSGEAQTVHELIASQQFRGHDAPRRPTESRRDRREFERSQRQDAAKRRITTAAQRRLEVQRQLRRRDEERERQRSLMLRKEAETARREKQRQLRLAEEQRLQELNQVKLSEQEGASVPTPPSQPLHNGAAHTVASSSDTRAHAVVLAPGAGPAKSAPGGSSATDVAAVAAATAVAVASELAATRKSVSTTVGVAADGPMSADRDDDTDRVPTAAQLLRQEQCSRRARSISRTRERLMKRRQERAVKMRAIVNMQRVLRGRLARIRAKKLHAVRAYQRMKEHEAQERRARELARRKAKMEANATTMEVEVVHMEAAAEDGMYMVLSGKELRRLGILPLDAPAADRDVFVVRKLGKTQADESSLSKGELLRRERLQAQQLASVSIQRVFRGFRDRQSTLRARERAEEQARQRLFGAASKIQRLYRMTSVAAFPLESAGVGAPIIDPDAAAARLALKLRKSLIDVVAAETQKRMVQGTIKAQIWITVMALVDMHIQIGGSSGDGWLWRANMHAAAIQSKDEVSQLVQTAEEQGHAPPPDTPAYQSPAHHVKRLSEAETVQDFHLKSPGAASEESAAHLPKHHAAPRSATQSQTDGHIVSVAANRSTASATTDDSNQWTSGDDENDDDSNASRLRHDHGGVRKVQGKDDDRSSSDNDSVESTPAQLLEDDASIGSSHFSAEPEEFGLEVSALTTVNDVMKQTLTQMAKHLRRQQTQQLCGSRSGHKGNTTDHPTGARRPARSAQQRLLPRLESVSDAPAGDPEAASRIAISSTQYNMVTSLMDVLSRCMEHWANCESTVAGQVYPRVIDIHQGWGMITATALERGCRTFHAAGDVAPSDWVNAIAELRERLVDILVFERDELRNVVPKNTLHSAESGDSHSGVLDQIVHETDIRVQSAVIQSLSCVVETRPHAVEPRSVRKDGAAGILGPETSEDAGRTLLSAARSVDGTLPRAVDNGSVSSPAHTTEHGTSDEPLENMVHMLPRKRHRSDGTPWRLAELWERTLTAVLRRIPDSLRGALEDGCNDADMKQLAAEVVAQLKSTEQSDTFCNWLASMNITAERTAAVASVASTMDDLHHAEPLLELDDVELTQEMVRRIFLISLEREHEQLWHPTHLYDGSQASPGRHQTHHPHYASIATPMSGLPRELAECCEALLKAVKVAEDLARASVLQGSAEIVRQTLSSDSHALQNILTAEQTGASTHSTHGSRPSSVAEPLPPSHSPSPRASPSPSNAQEPGEADHVLKLDRDGSSDAHEEHKMSRESKDHRTSPEDEYAVGYDLQATSKLPPGLATPAGGAADDDRVRTTRALALVARLGVDISPVVEAAHHTVVPSPTMASLRDDDIGSSHSDDPVQSTTGQQPRSWEKDATMRVVDGSVDIVQALSDSVVTIMQECQFYASRFERAAAKRPSPRDAAVE